MTIFTIKNVLSLLREDGVILEYVKATVTAEQLDRGVDLLRTPGNEITFIAGCTVEDQVWQSVRVSSEDHSALITLSVGDRIVGAFSAGADRQRLTEMRLITRGSTVRTLARSPAPTTARIVVEIFGWGVTQEMLPTVKDALRLVESS